MKPAIVLVHGAWHVPEIYAPFIARLKEAGYAVVCPALPSCAPSSLYVLPSSSASSASASPPPSAFARDVAAIRTATLALLDEASTRPIIYLLHSYGGAVGTEAASAFLRRPDEPRRIVHLIYLCGFMLQNGESVASASLPRPVPEPLEFLEQDGTSFLALPPRELFFADVEPRLAERAERLLKRMDGAAIAEKLGENDPDATEAWRSIHVTYVMCTADKVLFVQWQERQIEAVRKEGVHVDVKVLEGASHSPYLSRLEDVVGIVDEVTKKACEQEERA